MLSEPGCVSQKSLNATGNILVARGIARERAETVRCVFDPVGVAAERIDASSRIDVARRVAQKRRNTSSRVASPSGIAQKSSYTGSRVLLSVVEYEGSSPNASVVAA